METIEIKKITSNDTKDIVTGVEKALEVINQLDAEKDWQYKGDMFSIEDISEQKLNKSLNQRKKLKRRINSLLVKRSMRSANLFLRAVHYYFTDYGSAPRFDYSEKEKKIKAARKEYVKARDIAIKAYEEYKAEKGDYYKQ